MNKTFYVQILNIPIFKIQIFNMPVYHKVGMFVFINDIVLLCICYTDSELEDLKILQKFACKIWADRCYHL